jgi:sigma-B regulation protein RsbU (phosphoserine phosphatase)
MERLAVLGGPPIGLMEDIAHTSASVDLAPGDQILIVTDGITEAADPAGTMYGEARLEEFFAAVRPGEADALKRLTAVVRTFEAGAPPADDVAAVLLAIYDGADEVRLEPE